MSDAPFVLSAWLIVGATIVGYVGHILRRGRALSSRLPEERRRWL